MNRSLTIACAAMFALTVSARQLTPEEALDRALGSAVNRVAAIGQAVAPTVAYTASDADMRPMAYVFTQGAGQGYMVVSADDVAVPLLGYADKGTFDADNIPENMQWWLDEYARQIAAAADNGVAPVLSAAAAQDRKPVAPMLTTKWDQNAPYSDRCPEYSAGYHCPTGCVATAMAQVIKYHNYPERGKGSVSYPSSYNGYVYDVAFDYANTPFAYNRMADTYSDGSAAESREAVADLMLACGAGVGMLYTPNASGAASSKVPDALVTYFDYEPNTVLYRQRDWYGIREWEDLIYNELVTVGPVYYGGNNMASGHAFVCDGYSSDGYFHFNWGWSGTSDGYYLLSALEPTVQGTGGSNSGYNWNQLVVTGIQPPKAGVAPATVLVLYDNLTPSTTTANTGESVTFTSRYYNQSRVKLTGLSIAMRYTRADGTGEPIYASTDVTSSSLAVNSSLQAVKSTVPAGLAAGDYVVTPVFKSNGAGEWQVMCGANTYTTRSLNARVADGRVTFTADNVGLTIDKVEFASPFYQRRKFLVKATMTNTGDAEFHSTLCGAFFSSNESLLALSEVFYVDLLPGESKDVEYFTEIIMEHPTNFRLGAMRFAFMDYDLYYRSGNATVKCFGTPIDVTLKANVGNGTLTRDAFVVENSTSVNPASIKASATVTCTDGYFCDRMMLVVNDRTAGLQYVEQGRFYSVNPILVEKGETATAEFEFSLPQAEVGHTYYAMLWYYPYSAQLGRFVTFTIGDTTAIDEVEADGADGPVEYFNLQGIPVGADNLRHGEVYIRRSGTIATKIKY